MIDDDELVSRIETSEERRAVIKYLNRMIALYEGDWNDSAVGALEEVRDMIEKGHHRD